MPTVTKEELPPQQKRLLEVLLDVVGSQFDNSHENFTDIRAEMGCSQGVLRSLMHGLENKGFLRREIRRGNPKLWIVSVKGGAAPQVVRCDDCGRFPAQQSGKCLRCSGVEQQQQGELIL